MKDIRADFPMLEKYPNIVYFDNACTALKPQSVIDAIVEYYTEFGACGGRSSHQLARKTNNKLDESREKVANFVNADPEGLVWTRNATEALNLLASSFDFSQKRKVITTVMEHHSVLLPFMKLRDQGKIELEILPCDEHGEVGMEKWDDAVDKDCALIVTNSWNNTTGSGNDISKLSKLAHDNDGMICVDGAQGVPHHKTDLKGENIDFLCFSGHKMLGPTGIGALAMRKEDIPRLKPFIVGGGTVMKTSIEQAESATDQTRFEAGIQHYAGIIGFAAACEYLSDYGMENVEALEKEFADALVSSIVNAGATAYGKADRAGAVCSFNFKGGKPHDVALMLDKENIALRSGFFCAQPGLEAIGASNGAVRASAYIYNTLDEVKKFSEALEKVSVIYG